MARAGANSRVLRVDVGSVRYAAKHYEQRRLRTSERVTNEWRTLVFFRENGLTSTPEPVCHDAYRGLLIMEWIEGTPIENVSASDVEEGLSFIKRVFALSSHPTAGSFHPASEACLSGAEIRRQIEQRRLQFIDHAKLREFLDVVFAPELERAIAAAKDSNWVKPLELCFRRLIPADFGFHNALRQSDGRLRFIDFDFFGWDDPVKLVVDFVLHPSMKLKAERKEQFIGGIASHLACDTDFRERIRRNLPLFALRWSLIVLNPFRRDREFSVGASRTVDEALLTKQIKIATEFCQVAHAGFR